jgi:hypothetical protein
MDDSDEELQLNNDVALLNSQLKETCCPCDEKLYASVHLFRNLDGKPFAKRLKLWRFRKELSKTLVASLLSSSCSALSAASRDTAAKSPPGVKQDTEHKRKLEEPPFAGPSKQLHDKKPTFK